MSKGEVKNPQQDQRVGNKSGNQGRGSDQNQRSEQSQGRTRE